MTRGRGVPRVPGGGDLAPSIAFRLACAVAVFSLVLLRLPAIGSGGLVTAVGTAFSVAVLLLGLGCLATEQRSLLKGTRLAPGYGMFMPLCFAVLITAVAMVRGALSRNGEPLAHALADVLILGLVVVLVAWIALLARTPESRRAACVSVCLAPAVYTCLNLALWIVAGASGPGSTDSSSLTAGTDAALLGAIGIEAQRVNFPMANGVNNFADVAAVGVIFAFGLMTRATGRVRGVFGMLGFGCVVALVLTDARAAILLLPVAVAAGYWTVARARRAVWIAVVPFAAPLLVVVLRYVEGIPGAAFVSRSSADFATANNRSYVWQPAVDFLSTPKFAHIFGFGANGHITSGVANHYAYLFSTPDPQRYTVHSFVLQSILDAGYVGFVVLVVLMATSVLNLGRLSRCGRREAVVLCSGLSFFALIGVTDGAPWLYTPEALAAFLMIAAVSAGLVASGSADAMRRAALTRTLDVSANWSKRPSTPRAMVSVVEDEPHEGTADAPKY